MSSTDALHAMVRACGPALPLPPRRDDEPVFAAPWQAHAFALAIQLHAQGLYTWPEWAAALGAEIHGQPASAADPRDDGTRYYTDWLNALEKLVIAKQVGSADQIHTLEQAWEAAAARTPHGQPIELAPGELERLLQTG